MAEHGGGCRVLLGLQLRRLREGAGMNAWQAADKLGIAKMTVWQLERGDPRISFKCGIIEKMARIYGADDEAVADLLERARAVREGHWLDAFRDVLPRDLEGCLEVESYAARIRVYESEAVPSLLQLGQYAQARHGRHAAVPAAWMRIRLQQARFEMVGERAAAGVSFEFVVGENVLVRPVGGARLMADQLRRINEVGELSNVSVRVAPSGLFNRPELDASAFEIVDVPDTDRIAAYAAAFERAANQALSLADSRELIAELAGMFGRQARTGRALTVVPLV